MVFYQSLTLLSVLLVAVVAQKSARPIIMDCKYSVYGCCPDGVTDAKGHNGAGCTAPKAMAAPLCYSSEFGCCWDDVTERLPDRPCPPCYDIFRFACKSFKYGCFQKAGPKHRNFLRSNCKKTCGLCPL
ncbi:papilin [Nematostella vectensis]|uniref:papilin n=1 Tax=Nematostella vectensis TaxID=45351 RepID=UPI002077953F|nr:papilin [Nematostella vectensis]